MAELPRKTYTQITQLCARGDSHAEHGRLAEALAAYWAAWDVIPEPKTQWEAATWILGAVGDANFLGNDFKAGRDNLTTALRCPGGMGNPFVHLRLGQCLYELGDLLLAGDNLVRAYRGAGAEIFADEAPKYFDFVKTRLEPPPEGW